MLDAEHLSRLFEEVILDLASRGRCMFLGRAAPWFLRNRPDAFHVFVYAPRDWKIQRVISQGKTRSEAEDLVDNVDPERGAFIKKYHNKNWPQRDLYHMMINSKVGTGLVTDMLLSEIEALGAAHKRTA